MNPSSALVNRIWRLCTLLRKDGVTYQQYVNEITYLIFLKMMKERRLEDQLPSASRWDRLLSANLDLLTIYKDVLHGLRLARKSNGSITGVFADATTIVRDEKNLRALIDAIDELPWYDNGRDNFGDIYEGILEKNAEESKRGAGQYFTPRVIVDAIIKTVRPRPGETIQDPAAGTGGFLIGADEFVRELHQGKSKRTPYRPPVLVAMENVPETYRLLLMNLTLHEIDISRVYLGDTLSDDYAQLGSADLVLSNPPFGSAGGRPARADLEFTGGVSNFQLPFVEHCLRALNPNGRAAIVVPDNVLFEDGRARELRRYLLDQFHLHTLLRLPGGIFYAPGVKTNVLFLSRGRKAGSTWFYDLRTNMPAFGKSTPLQESALENFVEFYGARADGGDRNEATHLKNERVRMFTREALARRDDDLDIVWIKEGGRSPEDDLTDPAAIALAIQRHLKAALADLDALMAELGENGSGRG